MSTGKTYSTKYLLDSNNNRGAEGQILSTTSSGIDWVDANSVPGTGLWVTSGNNIYNSNSGNVGIGTTSPVTKLEVTPSTSNSSIKTGGLEMQSYAVNNSWYAENLYYDGGWKLRSAGYATQMYMQTGAITFNRFATGNADDFVVPIQTMILAADGNVGIGTTSPDTKLQVSGTSAVPSVNGTFQGGIFSIEGSSTVLLDMGTTGAPGYYTWMQAHDAGTGVNYILSLNPLGGNVGIGTTSPVDRLTIYDADNNVGAYFQTATSGTTSGDGFRVGLNNSHAFLWNYENTPISFGTNGSQKATILANGNVGIGTTSPSADLQVLSTKDGMTNGLDTNQLKLNYGASVVGAGSSVAFGVSSNLNFTGAKIVHERTASNSVGDLTFWTRQTGGSSTDYDLTTEKMRITSAGNVGIGTTLPTTALTIRKAISSEAYGSQASMIEFKSYYPGYDTETVKSAIYSGVSEVTTLQTTRGFMSFWTADFVTGGGQSLTEKMRIETDGNVGIGTTSPDAKLHINSSDATVVQRIQGATNSALEFYNSSTKTGAILVNSTQFLIAADNSNYLNINTGGSERMRIDSSGNVGIGTTSPNQPLEISKSVSGGQGATLRLTNIVGGTGAGSAIEFFGPGTQGIHAKIITQDLGVFDSKLIFQTKASGTGGSLSDRMTIDNVGAVKFNAYNGTNNTGSPTHILGTDASGNVVKSTAGSSIGPWLPLAAGSGNPLTGNLTISKVTPKLIITDTVASDLKLEISQQGSTTSFTSRGGTSSTGQFNFRITNGTTTTNALFINQQAKAKFAGALAVNGTGDSYFTGNVGIGTTSPDSILEISKAQASGPILKITEPTELNGTTEGGPGNNLGVLGFVSADTSTSQANLIRASVEAQPGEKPYGTGGLLTFNTMQTYTGTAPLTALIERMRIDASGNVGIGTDSPGYRLEVDGGIGDGVKIKAGNAASKDSLLVSTNNDVSKFLVQGDGKVIINSSAGISGRTENFQVFGKQIITNTGTDDAVLYLGYNSSGTNTIQLGRGRTDDGLSYMDFNGEVMSAGQFGFRIIRYDGQNASSELKQVGTGAFKLTCSDSADIILNPNSGSVGISQTNPSYKLDVTGDGRFTSTVTASNFILSSDERLKENVKKVCDNKVKADWKTFELKTEKGQKRYGVIAQELEKTNPEFVREDNKGFKSVAYIDLLIAKIAELESRLEKLEK